MPHRLIVSPLPETTDFVRQKRLIQERGELALIEDGLRMDHLAYFSLLPGEGRFRGGHYHRVKTERFYIIAGTGVLLAADPDTGETFETPLSPGLRITVLPGLAHRFEAASPLQVVEYYEGVYDPADDAPYPPFAGTKK